MLIGLTGGIATGKSTFCGFLRELADLVFFDADACVHELLSSDPAVITAVRKEFSLTPGTPVDRSVLRDIVFRDPAKRNRLEGILHPVVRQRWKSVAKECQQNGRNFLADIPLLFETAAAEAFDATVLIASSPDTQRARLASRGVDEVMIQAMRASQWPIGQKVLLADQVIWNDGSLDGLRRQAAPLLRNILPRWT